MRQGPIRLETLFDRAREGDSAATAEIDRIVRTFARQICSRGMPAWGQGLDWEDVAQEAGMRVLTTGLVQYSGCGSERSYIYSVVRSTVIQMARSAGRARRREDIHADRGSTSVSPGEGIEVGRILSALSPECRDLIERVFFHGRSYRELAVDFGIEESSVRSRLSRCVQAARTLGEGGRP